jgi:hypothetical protein
LERALSASDADVEVQATEAAAEADNTTSPRPGQCSQSMPPINTGNRKELENFWNPLRRAIRFHATFAGREPRVDDSLDPMRQDA